MLLLQWSCGEVLYSYLDNPMDRGAPGYGPRGGQELDMTEQAHTESYGGSRAG